MRGRSDTDPVESGRAVLWDVDGTLIDSADFHWKSWRDALAAEGYGLTYETFLSTFGQRNEEILRRYLGPDVQQVEIDRISGQKEDAYRSLVRTRGVEALPGVRRWLEKLRADGWKQAVASSAPPLNIRTILDALGFERLFDAVVSAEEIERGKPDPQIFLTAAARLNVHPEQCIVVEDAPSGVEAARRASMRSIGVLSSHPSLEADIVVQSLDELPDVAFERLLSD